MEDDKSLRIGENKQEEEEDDVKMEKFYELIRSFREARNYYKRKESTEWEIKKNKNKKMKRIEGEEQSSCNYWVPKFEQEDFDKEVEFRKPDHPLAPLVYPRQCNKDKEMKEGEEDGDLDLRLAL
ncbi:hypothetical protein I3843_08G082500 [Carya illinoinensis]|uniref:Uncharacterized protein n=1 Tax=Carya illinoinensis TaxID=32201 RepID=A0A8T1PX80_CARIL|nr:hypothetical protein CIPAW_08G085200 [Carya illinoinensis]KAG6699920.1 hypothetical protein I3842_08G085900 [Carya illinoinensis]KAG7967115.1 hypothetical protein I3843_08G082500 [Carya illinoinensis]